MRVAWVSFYYEVGDEFCAVTLCIVGDLSCSSSFVDSPRSNYIMRLPRFEVGEKSRSVKSSSVVVTQMFVLCIDGNRIYSRSRVDEESVIISGRPDVVEVAQKMLLV